MNLRHDDNPEETRSVFRSERLYVQNGQWFFSTREGEQGPYPTREDALRQLRAFISRCCALVEGLREHGSALPRTSHLTTSNDQA